MLLNYDIIFTELLHVIPTSLKFSTRLFHYLTNAIGNYVMRDCIHNKHTVVAALFILRLKCFMKTKHVLHNWFCIILSCVALIYDLLKYFRINCLLVSYYFSLKITVYQTQRVWIILLFLMHQHQQWVQVFITFIFINIHDIYIVIFNVIHKDIQRHAISQISNFQGKVEAIVPIEEGDKLTGVVEIKQNTRIKIIPYAKTTCPEGEEGVCAEELMATFQTRQK